MCQNPGMAGDLAGTHGNDGTTIAGEAKPRVAVVIPAHSVSRFIENVLARVDDAVALIIVVDDGCPEHTGDLVRQRVDDPRVVVIDNPATLGVGGAMVVGFRRALAEGSDIVVKLDGDGQHHPEWIPQLVRPIAENDADMVKGNRFYDVESVREMPAGRLLANVLLSFAAKLSTGYWNLFDPANGFLAIHRKVASRLPLDKIDPGYFFETDLLFRVGILMAKVVEVPVEAVYGSEKSGVRVLREAVPFLWKSLRNTVKRVLYCYFLRGFSVASLLLIAGSGAILFGVSFGMYQWIGSQEPATAGTVMLAGLPVLSGLQMLIGFIGHDISRQPASAIHTRLHGDGPARVPRPAGNP